jgi:hypothetical protein
MRVADARKAHVVQTPVEPRPGVDLHSVPMTNNEAPLPWMVEGCLAAVERLRVETQRGDADAKDTFFPSFDALNWAASIDLFLFENGAAVENDLLTGVRFARNRVHHQWAKALVRADSPGIPRVTLAASSSRIVGPPPGFWWYWVGADQLPARPPRVAPPLSGKEQYKNNLAGKPAEATLEALRPILEALS